MSTVASDVTNIKRSLNQNISSTEKRYNGSLASNAVDVLSACNMTSPEKLDQLQLWLSNVRPTSAVPPKLLTDIGSLRQAEHSIFNVHFPTAFQRMLIAFGTRNLTKNEQQYCDRLSSDKAKDLLLLSTEINDSLPFPKLSTMDLLGKLSLTDAVFKYGEGYGKMVCSAAAVLLGMVFLSTSIGVGCHSEEVPPNKRGFLSNQAGIMLVLASLVMWLFCSAMMPSTILFMMSGVVAEAYICSPFRLNNTKLLDEVIGALYIRPNLPKEPGLYNSTMKPSWILTHCPSNPTLINFTGKMDLRGIENVLSCYNPPKYYKWLEDGVAFASNSFDLYFRERLRFSTRERSFLQDISQQITNIIASGTNLPSTPISVNTAQKYAQEMSAAFTVFAQGTVGVTGQWDKMDACIAREMNANLFQAVKPNVDPYLQALKNISDHVYGGLGHCKPLSDFYFNAFTLFCDATLDNMNGFWVSLWLVTFLFSVMIVTGLKLSKYFMRMDDYTYGGIELEESVDEDDGGDEGDSVSYAPSASANVPEGRYRWRRPRIDIKFEVNPYHMPDMEAVEAGETVEEESLLDVARWQLDRAREFIPYTLGEDIRLAKMARQRLPRTTIQQQQMMVQQQMMQPPMLQPPTPSAQSSAQAGPRQAMAPRRV